MSSNKKTLEIRQSNTTAVVAIRNIIKSSFGPEGLDKMILNDVGDVNITNDGATILGDLEIQHPAAKLLVELATQQDAQVGDGTTSVALYTAEFLANSMKLIQEQRIHPTSIILGYKRALREALKYIREHCAIKVSDLGDECLFNIAKTSLSSKILSADLDYFSNLCVESIKKIKRVGKDGKAHYPIKNINILKAHGGSMSDSRVIEGLCLNYTRAGQGMPRIVKNAKIALLDFSLQKWRLHMGMSIEITDPKKLEEVREEEIKQIQKKIELILNAGANVILCSGGIDDLCIKFLVEKNAIGVRRVRKAELEAVAKATGGVVVSSLENLEGEEEYDSSNLGLAEEVCEERVADDEAIFIKHPQSSSAISLLLRGPSDYALDEMERSLNDSIHSLASTLESELVVVGGGCVDTALNVHLENWAKKMGTKEQLAASAWAESLLTIPKILATNAAKDSTELIAQLRTSHAISQGLTHINIQSAPELVRADDDELFEKENNSSNKSSEKNDSTDSTESTSTPLSKEVEELKWSGLDLRNGKVVNNLQNGVLEPVAVKLTALQLATDAAITILRVDDHIQIQEDKKGDQN